MSDFILISGSRLAHSSGTFHTERKEKHIVPQELAISKKSPNLKVQKKTSDRKI